MAATVGWYTSFFFRGFALFHCVGQPQDYSSNCLWEYDCHLVSFFSRPMLLLRFEATGPKWVKGRDLNRLGACTKRNYIPRCSLTWPMAASTLDHRVVKVVKTACLVRPFGYLFTTAAACCWHECIHVCDRIAFCVLCFLFIQASDTLSRKKKQKKLVQISSYSRARFIALSGLKIRLKCSQDGFLFCVFFCLSVCLCGAN